MNEREKLIKSYINAYNIFDIDGMVKNLHPSVKFENISNGEISMTLTGVSEFRQQAESAKSFFESRRQTIKSVHHQTDKTEVTIVYDAVLAIDLPNGLKKGDELNLEGKSIFWFSDDQISQITDIS